MYYSGTSLVQMCPDYFWGRVIRSWDLVKCHDWGGVLNPFTAEGIYILYALGRIQVVVEFDSSIFDEV